MLILFIKFIFLIFLSLCTLFSFWQVLIPDIGRVQPSGIWETAPSPFPHLSPYIAMSDCFMLFPQNDLSTAVWDLANDRRAGVLEVHDSPVKYGGA